MGVYGDFSNWWVLCGILTVGTAILTEDSVQRLCQISKAQIKTRPNWLGEVPRRPWKKMITVACPSGPGCLLDFLGGGFKASRLGRAVGLQGSGFRFEVKSLACIYPDNLGSDFREISVGSGLFFWRGLATLSCVVTASFLGTDPSRSSISPPPPPTTTTTTTTTTATTTVQLQQPPRHRHQHP